MRAKFQPFWSGPWGGLKIDFTSYNWRISVDVSRRLQVTLIFFVVVEYDDRILGIDDFSRSRLRDNNGGRQRARRRRRRRRAREENVSGRIGVEAERLTNGRDEVMIR